MLSVFSEWSSESVPTVERETELRGTREAFHCYLCAVTSPLLNLLPMIMLNLLPNKGTQQSHSRAFCPWTDLVLPFFFPACVILSSSWLLCFCPFPNCLLRPLFYSPKYNRSHVIMEAEVKDAWFQCWRLTTCKRPSLLPSPTPWQFTAHSFVLGLSALASPAIYICMVSK